MQRPVAVPGILSSSTKGFAESQIILHFFLAETGHPMKINESRRGLDLGPNWYPRKHLSEDRTLVALTAEIPEDPPKDRRNQETKKTTGSQKALLRGLCD